MENQSVAEKTLQEMKAAGAEKSMVSVSSVTSKEFNVEAGKLTLLRTTFDQKLGMQALLDQRQAQVSGNQFSQDAIQQSAKSVVSTAKSSPQDAANGFAPSQGTKKFSFGAQPPDEEWMYTLLSGLLKEREPLFPKISFEAAVVKFVKTERALLTSEGTNLQSEQGHYEGFVMFTAKDGKKASSFNYTGFQLPASEVGQPISLMEKSGLRELLKQSSEQINVQKVPSKFEGDVIVTPHCLGDFVGGWFDFLGPGQMLKGSSFFKDKIGEKVASPKWTVSSHPVDSTFASRRFWTGDGYLAENESIFENGILKNYLLDHYSASKLGGRASRSGGSYLQVANGNTSLQNMIKSVKKGVLLCRYSAGRPAENGDISGVAKNSYYIENGEIRFPLGETMVAMNLQRMLHDIQDVSSETINFGTNQMPWVRFSGASVS